MKENKNTLPLYGIKENSQESGLLGNGSTKIYGGHFYAATKSVIQDKKND